MSTKNRERTSDTNAALRTDALVKELKASANYMRKLAGSLAWNADRIDKLLTSGASKERSVSDGTAEQVREAWEHYLTLRDLLGVGGPTPQLSATRRGHLSARIREHGLKTVKEALSRLMDTKYWWASPVDKEGKPKKAFVDIKFAVRSSEQLEKVLSSPPLREFAEKQTGIERRDGNVYLNGKRVYFSGYQVSEEDRESGNFVILNPNDPRLKT